MATRGTHRGRRHPSVSDDDDDERAAEIEELQCHNHGNRRRRPSLDNVDDVDERSEEIKCLQKSGILPQDFPMVKGLNKYDDDDVNRELQELLQQGAISKDDADKMQKNRGQNSEKLSKTLATSHKTDEAINKVTISPYGEDGIPLNWSRDTPQRARYTLIELNGSDPTFVAINSEFEAANISITKIERLQNVHMLEKFKAEADQMEKHRSQSFDVNARYLYHGTSVDKDRICEEGLDQRLSRMGYFGKGIYFSDNPIKCIHYSEDSIGPNEACILMCRVILGDSKVYDLGCYDTTLKREPEKDNTTDDWRYYDSVMGCPKDYNEYVVYDNRRAMIEYIISFKIDETVADQLRRQDFGANTPENHAGDAGNYAVLSDEDHFQRICEVREAVRQKRMEEQGLKYIPPTQEKMQHDKEMWMRLQQAHGVLPSAVNTDTKAFVGEPNVDHSTSIHQRQHRYHSPPRSPSFQRRSPATYTTDDWQYSGTGDTHNHANDDSHHDSDNLHHDDSDNHHYGDEDSLYDAVGQVLSSCIAEFLSVTSLDDADLAKYYVQKADMDINKAISIYYEDSFDT